MKSPKNTVIADNGEQFVFERKGDKVIWVGFFDDGLPPMTNSNGLVEIAEELMDLKFTGTSFCTFRLTETASTHEFTAIGTDLYVCRLIRVYATVNGEKLSPVFLWGR